MRAELNGGSVMLGVARESAIVDPVGSITALLRERRDSKPVSSIR